MEQSRQSTEPAALRTKSLDEARQELKQFAEANPHKCAGRRSAIAVGARCRCRAARSWWRKTAQLPKEPTYDAQRKTLGREARVMFAEARDTFQRAEAIYSAELEKLPPTSSSEAQGDTGSKRQEYRGRVAQLRFLAAQTQFEEAQSYPPEADEFRKLNESAAQELSTSTTNSLGRCWSGCMRGFTKADVIRRLVRVSIGFGLLRRNYRQGQRAAAVSQTDCRARFNRKAEVLIAQKKYDEAINACRACLKDAHKDEATQPEWLGVRYHSGGGADRRKAKHCRPIRPNSAG